MNKEKIFVFFISIKYFERNALFIKQFIYLSLSALKREPCTREEIAASKGKAISILCV
jgi:hypothetical protein